MAICVIVLALRLELTRMRELGGAGFKVSVGYIMFHCGEAIVRWELGYV